MDKISTKIKVSLTKKINKHSIKEASFFKNMRLLNLFNNKEHISISCNNYIVLESFKNYLGICLYVFLMRILYFNAAFLFNSRNEKA